MNSKMWKMMLLVAVIAGMVMSATYTVSKPGGFGAYNTIQEAVNSAKDGDEVVIMDFGTYEEQVTIFELKNFTLRSENPASARKPTIKYQDTKNILPQVRADAKDSARINFDQNGALRVMRSTNILIEGIAVDGGGNYPFGSKEDVWENTKENKWYPMQHGNAALVLWIAGGVTVRHCDLSNAFFGISFKDRNEGGIFANTNPADIQTWKVVPLSGFGKTGEHVVEYNRIHNNSVGVYFESTWDLGSVIRYNLIYENHHPQNLSSRIKELTSDGQHFIGGAMMFKDHILSPLTVHNNTFYRNTYVFVGNWRSGGHYLIFNNIVAEPYSDPNFKDPWQVLDPYFHNRMYNSVYAAHIQPIQTQTQNVQVSDDDPDRPGRQIVVPVTVYQPRIMNGFGEVQGTNLTVPIELSSGAIRTQTITNVRLPGGLIASTQAGGFSAANNIRWLEWSGKGMAKFKSTDPKDANFLEPDWDDSLVNRYIVDKGYEAVGITDPDGSPADLGAIPKEGGKVSSDIRITPTAPVSISGTTAMVSFVLSGDIVDPKIKYIRWVQKLPDSAVFGQQDVVIPRGDIITPPSIPSVKAGSNVVTFSIPSRSSSNLYAFFELVIEGTDPETKLPVQSVVGSLPYRKIDYEFLVEIFDTDGKTKKTSVVAGQPVILKITPKRLDNKPWDDQSAIEQTDVTLFSGFDLLDATDKKLEVPKFTKSYQAEVKFTRVPPEGIEFVAVGGLFKATSSDFLAIRGTSDQIIVRPGPPDYLEFQSPPSKGRDKIDPGREYDVRVAVYDKYGNRIDQRTDVSLQSTKPDKGNVVGGGPKTEKTDTTGIVRFKVEVTNGIKNDSIPLVAKLIVTDSTDKATLIVGEPRDKLLIFYPGDSAGTTINQAVKIDTCSDQFVPIVIKRIGMFNNVATVMAADSDTVTFDIEKSGGIGVYDKPNGEAIKTIKKMKGQVTVWIKATNLNVSNGSIKVYPVDNPTVLSGERGNITFNHCNASIVHAAYFADFGDGRVNRLEIYYNDTLGSNHIPDTFQLYWPNKQGDPRIVLGNDPGSVKLDASDKKHITVTLKNPFNPDPMVTRNITPSLGTSIWKNKLLEDAPFIKANFNIADSVGPLLTSAVLVEKLDKSKDDTLYVTFSEKVDGIIGKTLKISKKNDTKTIELNIKNAVNVAGDTIKLIVGSLNEDSPQEGDSLSIVPSGPIVDDSKNHAHEKNRPVIIRLKSVHPDINSAFYKDYDGDGVIDYITVFFNKKVILDSIRVKFTWNDGDSSPTISDKERFSYAKDSTAISVNVNNLFKEGVRTSGAMSVDVIYQNYDNAKSAGSVADSAAPVIMEAKLFPGSLEDDGKINKDTLQVTFSEIIRSVELSNRDEFFEFFHNGAPYRIKMAKYREEGIRISFIVESIEITSNKHKEENFTYPQNDDLVRMLTGNDGIFADDNGNYQIEPDNRKAPLKVNTVPTNVTVKAGPIPFNPVSGQTLKITVKPKAKMVEGCSTYAQVRIYDRLGNKLFDKAKWHENENQRTVEIEWDGYNLKGKRVGYGTYLARVNYTLKIRNEKGGFDSRQGSEDIKVAVRKND